MRRKFLRQNRDIARVNSAQSLRIRSLESECGRLLSENLTLNGRILELERELEESNGAQRIADHALEIKAKMEAQLVEWGAMLQGLGFEPAAKRHATTSPGGRKIARPRKSGDRFPAAKRRPRDSRTAEEVAATQEGRLPPIHENKTYPRRTMRYVAAPDHRQGFLRSANPGRSHAELLAVCTEAADANDSPDLGPPPTSRFVEEDPVKIDSPSRSTGTLEPSPKIKGETLPPPEAPAPMKLDPKKRPGPATDSGVTKDPSSAKTANAAARPLLKAGSKRKFGDENDETQLSRPFANKEKVIDKSGSDKFLAVRDLKNGRNGKDSSKHGHGTEPTTMRPRKPLGEKSTNDDLVSPKKVVKSTATSDLKVAAEPDRAVAPLKKKRVVPIKLAIPSLPAPSTVKTPQEPATPSADPGVVFHDSPQTKSAGDNPKDTPPPADISAQGEILRPSRRARPAISYAEPNLRDKMRRPTKELFDAVTGEGKFRRSSSAHPLGPLSSSKTKANDESTGPESSRQPQNAEAAMANEAARRPTVTSPLLQREPTKERSQTDLPGPVATERHRRPSSRQSQIFMEHEEEEDATEDPYEFQSTSPAFAQLKDVASKGRITKGMRRSMAASAEQGNDVAESAKPSRKRASMAAPRKASMFDSPLDDDSSYEASEDMIKMEPSSFTKDKISRRRSMML